MNIADAADFAAEIPPNFLVGTATSAFQIEGAVEQDGRTPSTWDAWLGDPSKAVDGSDARNAVDHYNRMPQDVALMREAGLDAYRFSVSWSRIFPEPGGAPNPAGVDFYRRLLQELSDAGITSVLTLFHWDTPAYLETGDGWLSRNTATAFADYAAFMGQEFGGLVDYWCTINEPATVVGNGYASELHAPARNVGLKALPAAHHLLLAHGMAVQALRDAGVRGKIGMSNVHSPVVPASEKDPLATAGAAIVDVAYNWLFADPVLKGEYPWGVEKLTELMGATIHDGDLEIISTPLDFYGLNYYMPTKIASGPGPDGPVPASMLIPNGQDPSPLPLPTPVHQAEWPDRDMTAYGWPIAPEYLGVMLSRMRDRYPNLPPLLITEGGVSFEESPDPDRGRVEDHNRIEYLQDHLRTLFATTSAGGVAEGVSVGGYFIWSLVDNWEWAAGYRQKFGLVHVDRISLERTPKASYSWVRDVQRARLSQQPSA
ncbi:beta-glucosidase [Neomicrococcus aestuarii]|uniref:Beta-glucosidase n=1 Tax=Neomicrococcus aestuarii TaxID=556325 RepID=A0A7W8X1N3_9MICC|nr:family 1 glycosylhydrolase [Neomicrococcus aestuarii]MBB5512974.1 beta-glucosidase [Neomicrococcus aestuarii]